MISSKKILSLLSDMIVATPTNDGVRVTTHVLYPSNAAVSVVVRGGENSVIVSDEAGGASELHKAGIVTLIFDRRLAHRVKHYGLRVSDGAILSPTVPVEATAAAIVLVANASKTVVDWGLSNLHYHEKRNFRKDLAELLGRHFHGAVSNDGIILGKSNKPHKFTHVVNLSGDRKLLIDPVVNEASSINARLVANLDVRLTNNPNLKQLIVYDDSLRWKGSDLKLLEMGAPTVAFSKADQVIDRLAA